MKNQNSIPFKKAIPDDTRKEIADLVYTKQLVDRDKKVTEYGQRLAALYNQHIAMDYMRTDLVPCVEYVRMIFNRYLTEK